MVDAHTRRLRLWQDRIDTDVDIVGAGPPLVYLHGAWGLRPDLGFIRRLAEAYTIYAPRHPGTSQGESEAVHALSSWHDLIVYYGELFERLALHAPVFVGHSFGGLVAAELAAATPKAVKKLVLIDPIGLWREDLPVRNWMLLSEAERRPSLFADPEGEPAHRFFAVPADPDARVDHLADIIWAQACTAKFVWPVPDRGLNQRIHRIAAPSLIVWGTADRIVRPAYAEEFTKRIAGAQIKLIDNAGHLPHLEQTETVAKAVLAFLGG